MVAERLRFMRDCARFCHLISRKYKQFRMFTSTHNPKVAGSNPAPATNKYKGLLIGPSPLFHLWVRLVASSRRSTAARLAPGIRRP